MNQQLNRETAEGLLRSRQLESMTIMDMVDDIMDDVKMTEFVPDSVCQIDPRTGELVVYNSSRAKRIHTTTSQEQKTTSEEVFCPICSGQSTGIIDLTPQSEGFTFINKNLFPILHPMEHLLEDAVSTPLYADPLHHGRTSYGFHFLQWTSSLHERDWHNISHEDALICMERLACMEKQLLYQAKGFMPPTSSSNSGQPTYGYVSIIKNYGHEAGASLTHGHQQIAHSNIMPQRYFNNLGFLSRNNRTFAEYMLKENPAKLMIHDYGAAVLLVPYFMRRPYNMLLIMKDFHKQYLHELNLEEKTALTRGLQDSIKALMTIMPQLGKQPAYNLNINNGPGAGLYVEILAATQITGGFEQIGLWVCQASPYDIVKTIREVLKY
ncbi:MAG: hypothetical protein HQM11_16770 [SAR324 cluster bacterium]|nr:hypothetical protein [SAR324 cluster bacterium]